MHTAKRARSALSRERTLQLRQCCSKSRECSVRRDKGRTVQVNRRKRTVAKRNHTVLILIYWRTRLTKVSAVERLDRHMPCNNIPLFRYPKRRPENCRLHPLSVVAWFIVEKWELRCPIRGYKRRQRKRRRGATPMRNQVQCNFFSKLNQTNIYTIAFFTLFAPKCSVW